MAYSTGKYGRRRGNSRVYFPLLKAPVPGKNNRPCPDGLYLKLENKFDFGLKLDSSIGVLWDQNFIVNQFSIDITSNADYYRLVDSMSFIVDSTPTGTIGSMYPANATVAEPGTWTSSIIPYQNYRFLGVKVDLKINPRISFAMDGNVTETQRVAFGMAMDHTLGSQVWYNAPMGTAGLPNDYRTRWGSLAQCIWRELPTPMQNKPCRMSKYFSFAKYHGLTNDQYAAEDADVTVGTTSQFGGGVGYYTGSSVNNGTVATTAGPDETIKLHFMAQQFGDWEDGTQTETAIGNLTGTLKFTYYVRLFLPHPVVQQLGQR